MAHVFLIMMACIGVIMLLSIAFAEFSQPGEDDTKLRLDYRNIDLHKITKYNRYYPRYNKTHYIREIDGMYSLTKNIDNAVYEMSEVEAKAFILKNIKNADMKK